MKIYNQLVIMKSLTQLKFIFASLAAMVFWQSCMREENPDKDSIAQVSMKAIADVDIMDSATRSSIVSGSESSAFEQRLNNITLFQFQDGELCETYYATRNGGSIQVNVRGDIGMTYTFYSIGNNGNMSGLFPNGTSISDFLSGIQIRYSDPTTEIANGGIPMFCAGEFVNDRFSGIPVTFSETGGTFNLNFTRLTARYDLVLDTSGLKYGSFIPSSLVLAQSPKVVYPFERYSSSSVASDFTSGDRSTSEDLSELSSGRAVSFFILENCKGNLLANNTNPWAKVPESIPGNSGICTYLELTGTYTDKSGGLSAEHTYRMYLGRDNITNFDVTRNTSQTLSLTLTDDAFLKGSWKVERDIISDTRSMHFENDSYEVTYRTPVTARLLTSGDIGVEYSLSQNLVDAGVSYNIATCMLSQSVQLDADVTGTLTSTSWDKVHSVSTQVVAKKYKTNSQITIDPISIEIHKGGAESFINYSYISDGELHVQLSSLLKCKQVANTSSKGSSTGSFSETGCIYVQASDSTPTGTYQLQIVDESGDIQPLMDKEGNIHESATINVIEASTVPESPVGLVEIMVDNSRLHPCSEQSGVMVHDSNCPLNHELYFQDDYISIEQCPNWYGKTVPAGRAGIVKMSFKIGHNYSVDSDGRLTYQLLTPTVDYEVLNVNVVGNDGHIQKETQIESTEYDIISKECSLLTQFQDGSLCYFEVTVATFGNNVDNGIRTYLIDFDGNVMHINEGEYSTDNEINVTYSYRELYNTWYIALVLTGYHNCSTPVYWIYPTDSFGDLTFDQDYDLKAFPNNSKIEIFGNFQLFTSNSAAQTTKVYSMDRRGIIFREDDFSFGVPSVDIMENAIFSNGEKNSLFFYNFYNQLKMSIYAGFKDAKLPFTFQDLYSYDNLDNPGRHEVYENDNLIQTIWFSNSTQDGSVSVNISDNVLTGKTSYLCGTEWEFTNLQVPAISTDYYTLEIRDSDWSFNK